MSPRRLDYHITTYSNILFCYAALVNQTTQWKLPANSNYLAVLMHLYLFQATEVYWERKIPLLPLHLLYALHKKDQGTKKIEIKMKPSVAWELSSLFLAGTINCSSDFKHNLHQWSIHFLHYKKFVLPK